MKSGKDSVERSLNYLIGSVMIETSGRANPQLVRQMILDRLNARQERERSISSPDEVGDSSAH